MIKNGSRVITKLAIAQAWVESTKYPMDKRFEKMVDWFQLNDFMFTESAWKRVFQFIRQERMVLDLLNKTK